VGDHNSISRRESNTAAAGGREPLGHATATRQCGQGHAVPIGTKFCPQCGVLVTRTCTNGHAVEESMKFCGECGAAAGSLPSGTL
jgi:hypothetical protein